MKAIYFEREEDNGHPKYFICGKDIGLFDSIKPEASNKADQCDGRVKEYCGNNDPFREENEFFWTKGKDEVQFNFSGRKDDSSEFKNDALERKKQEIQKKEQAINQLMERIRIQNYQAIDIKTELKNLKKKEVKIKERKKELEKEKEQMEFELVQLKDQLQFEEEPLKQSFQSNVTYKPKEDQKFCVICMNKKANHALVPCGHMSYCGQCCKKLKQCGICRKSINTFIQIFD